MSKTLITLFSLLVLQQSVMGMDILREIQNNRPQLYEVPVMLEYSSAALGYGTGYVSVQKAAPHIVTFSYVELIKFIDHGFWQGKNLNDLGDSVIATVTQFTLFGDGGLLPMIGIKTYNTKYISAQLGLAFLAGNEDYKLINTASLVYDFFLEKVSFSYSLSM